MTLPIAPAEISGARRRTAAARKAEAGAETQDPYASGGTLGYTSGDWLLQQVIGLEDSALEEASSRLEGILRSPKQCLQNFSKQNLTSVARRKRVASVGSASLEVELPRSYARSATGRFISKSDSPLHKPSHGNVRESTGEHKYGVETQTHIELSSSGDDDDLAACSTNSAYSNSDRVQNTQEGDPSDSYHLAKNALQQSSFLRTVKGDHMLDSASMGSDSNKDGAGGLGKDDEKQIENTEILKTWFFEHVENPYPSPEQKKMLRGLTGLTSTQIRNWFTNFRKRHWNPIRAGREPKSYVDFILYKRLQELGVPGLHGGLKSFKQLSTQLSFRDS